MSIDALTLLRAQCANHILADRRLARACDRLSEGAYYGPRACFFGSIHATLDHIVTTDQRYLDRLSGIPTPPTGDDGITYGTRQLLSAARTATHTRLKDYMAALTPDDLETEQVLHVTDRWGRAEEPVWLVLQHVFAHGVHHRGQVHDLLSQTDVAPPQLDEFFLRMDRATRKGEVAAAGVGTWMVDGLG